jgi:hypothetical protein
LFRLWYLPCISVQGTKKNIKGEIKMKKLLAVLAIGAFGCWLYTACGGEEVDDSGDRTAAAYESHCASPEHNFFCEPKCPTKEVVKGDDGKPILCLAGVESTRQQNAKAKGTCCKIHITEGIY